MIVYLLLGGDVYGGIESAECIIDLYSDLNNAQMAQIKLEQVNIDSERYYYIREMPVK
jgi:hypothetical protein